MPATLQTVDGRLLQLQRPAGARVAGGLGGMFPPMWSTGEREANGLTEGALVSYEQIYRTQPVVAAIVDKLSRRIATLPFDSYLSDADGSVTEAPASDSLESLIEHPMPGWGSVKLVHHIAQSLLVHGNALVAKLRGPDRESPPIMLWPIDWATTNAYGVPGGRVEWWSTLQFDGQERFISRDDTLHFAWAAPSGNEVGVSPLEKLGITVRLEDAAQRHQAASFRNGNRPSLAVTLDPAASGNKDAIEVAQRNLDALHKGPDNSAKTLFLTGGAKVQPMSLTPVEAELIEQRRLNREEMGMVYDLAGPLMNDLTHGTYSNVAELTKGLYRDVVPPWTSLIEQTFQVQLLDPEPAWMDRSVCFDFSDKLRGDPLDLANTLKVQVEAGLITRNEARKILNLPPVGDATDATNTANQLTMNVNNQAPVDQTSPTPPTAPPASQE